MRLVEHLQRRRQRHALAGALLVPLGVAAAFVPFRASFTNVGAALALVAVIEAIAIVGRRAGGVVATLSAAAWFDFFLTAPYERFAISQRPDLETTISLVVVGLMVTELAARSRAHRLVAGEESVYVSLLAATAAGASAATHEELISRATEDLTSLLSLRECHFEADVSGPPHAQILADGRVAHVGVNWPADELGIPGPVAEIPCVWRGSLRGRFTLTPSPGVAVTAERRIVAVALVNVVAGSLSEGRRPAPPPRAEGG